MKVFYVFLLLPLLSHAITVSKTNTKTIQETKLTRPEVAPFSEGSDVVPTPVQQQQERPIEDPEAIKTGPYDKDGNYIYLKKKP